MIVKNFRSIFLDFVIEKTQLNSIKKQVPLILYYFLLHIPYYGEIIVIYF